MKKEFVINFLKKAAKFGALLGIIYLLWALGMYLFPGTLGSGTQEAGSEVVGFWTTAYETIKGSFKEVVKQIFMNIHQSIVLFFVGWLFTGVRRLWTNSRERVYALMDVLLGKMSQERRENIKKHLDTIIIANIELVESAFATVGGGENEDIEEKRRRNEEKLTAALTMTLYDLMKDDAGREMVKNYTKEEIVRLLICEIEKNLLKQKVGADNGEPFISSIMSTSMTNGKAGLADDMTEASASRLRGVIQKTSEGLSEEYKTAIADSLKGTE